MRADTSASMPTFSCSTPLMQYESEDIVLMVV